MKNLGDVIVGTMMVLIGTILLMPNKVVNGLRQRDKLYKL